MTHQRHRARCAGWLPHADRGRGEPTERRRGGGHLRRARRGSADAFAFRAGQSLTLRRMIDGGEERRSYSICAPAGARAADRRAGGPGRAVLPLAGARGPAGRRDLGRDAQPAASRPARATARPSRADRGRLRDHAGAVDRRHRAAGPGGDGDGALRQPAHRHGDVRRRAGRPEGPLPGPARPGARAVPRAARGRAALRPARRGQADRLLPRLIEVAAGRPLVAVRAVRDGRARAGPAARPGVPRRADPPGAVLRRGRPPPRRPARGGPGGPGPPAR